MCQRKGDTDRVSSRIFIFKYWNGVPYRGIITSNTGIYYNIFYEDNNKEELNHTEVVKYEKKNREEGRMTGEIGQRMRLMKPLGNWLILANDSEWLRPFYYSEETYILYRSYRKNWEKNGEFYYDCHKIADNDTYNYKPDGNMETLPKDASPTGVMDTEGGWRISNHQPVQTKQKKQDRTRRLWSVSFKRVYPQSVYHYTLFREVCMQSEYPDFIACFYLLRDTSVFAYTGFGNVGMHICCLQTGYVERVYPNTLFRKSVHPLTKYLVSSKPPRFISATRHKGGKEFLEYF